MRYSYYQGVASEGSNRLALIVSSILTVLLITFIAITQNVAASTDTVITVRPNDMATNLSEVNANPDSWFFFNDENNQIDNTLGVFVAGPATPPLGTASVELSVSGTQRKNLATYQFGGTVLSEITRLKYSTYNPTFGNSGSVNRSGYLQFNVDFTGVDNWQRRLVFLPSDNGAVQQDSWQEWDAINDGDALWRYSGAEWPVSGGLGTNPKTWDQILSEYSGVRVRVSDPFMGIRVGEPYADGYTENIDKFVFATTSSSKVFDFEQNLPLKATNKEECKNGNWETGFQTSYKNQGQCVASVTSSDKSKLNR